MTLNKYQKYNESLRLDESAKEKITANLLQKEIRPAKQTLRYRWAALSVFVLAILLFVVLPVRNIASAPGPAQTAEHAAAGDAEAAEAAAETAEEGLIQSDYRDWPGIVSVSSEDHGNGILVTEFVTENNTITVMKEPAGKSEDAWAENAVMEAEESDTVTEYELERDGYRYVIRFAEPVSEAEAAAFAEYLKAKEEAE